MFLSHGRTANIEDCDENYSILTETPARILAVEIMGTSSATATQCFDLTESESTIASENTDREWLLSTKGMYGPCHVPARCSSISAICQTTADAYDRCGAFVVTGARDQGDFLKQRVRVCSWCGVIGTVPQLPSPL